MSSDLAFAWRRLRASPAFAVTVTLCLAIGLGANTAAFSLLDAIVLRPLPFPSAQRLVDVHETSATALCDGCGVGTSHVAFTEWRRDARSFDAVAGYLEGSYVLGATPATASAPQRVSGAFVTPALFGMLGARPTLGRALVAADEVPGAARVVVLGRELWLRRFGGDSTIIGRAIGIDGATATVVGVMAPRFRFPATAEVWMPLSSVAPADDDRSNREVGVVARLRPGVSPAVASAEMHALASVQAREHASTQREWTAEATPLRDDMSRDQAGFGWMLFGVVLLVQLVVCANVAGLILTRSSARTRELALRAALGASRRRIARLMLMEIALLAAIGATLGLVLAANALSLVRSAFADSIPYWIDPRIDWRVVAFAIAMTTVCALAIGSVVAWRASRPNGQGALKDAGPNASASRRQSRVRALLVLGQLSTTLVLLACAGLLLKSSLRLMRPSEGAAASRLVTAELAMNGPTWDDGSRLPAVVDELEARITRVRGVEAAGVSRMEFLAGFGRDARPISIEGRATPAGASPRFAFAVTPAWLRARAVAIATGRAFTSADRAGSEPTVLINAAMAERLWPGESALGKRVKLGPDTSSLPWRTIVGVMRDESVARTSDRPTNVAYVPFAQWPGRPLAVLARVTDASRARSVASSLIAASAAVLPDEPMDGVQTLANRTRVGARPYWLSALSVAALAGFAVLVAALGVYGVIAQSAAQRTREIGVRIALGAAPRDILALFGRQTAWMVMFGVAFGLVASAAVTRSLRGMLFGLDPLDVPVLVAVTALLAIVAMLAGALPSRRAAKLDPLVALRRD